MKIFSSQAEERQPSGIAASFASRIPAVDRWMRKRAVVGGLLEETSKLERRASEWEERGHWQMAGRTWELGARMVERVMDYEPPSKHAMRWQGMLRKAIVCYAVEIGEAGRYDPAVEYRMHLVARKAGQPQISAERMRRAMAGFHRMYEDRNLEALIRLNRIKREFLYALWEGDALDALRSAAEAESVAAEIRAHDRSTDRAKDTVAWLEGEIGKRFPR